MPSRRMVFWFRLTASCLREVKIPLVFYGILPSFAPEGYALQRLVDADDISVALTPLIGECESIVACIRCSFTDQLEKVIIRFHNNGPSKFPWGTLALTECSEEVCPLTITRRVLP